MVYSNCLGGNSVLHGNDVLMGRFRKGKRKKTKEKMKRIRGLKKGE